MTMGERLLALRLQNNLTQTDVAEYIETNKQTIYKYEKDIIRNIPLDKLEKLANLFNVSAAYLVGWEK